MRLLDGKTAYGTSVREPQHRRKIRDPAMKKRWFTNSYCELSLWEWNEVSYKRGQYRSVVTVIRFQEQKSIEQLNTSCLFLRTIWSQGCSRVYSGLKNRMKYLMARDIIWSCIFLQRQVTRNMQHNVMNTLQTHIYEVYLKVSGLSR